MTDSFADPGITGRLVSGEAVELDVRVARLGSRVLAFVIDFLLMILFGGFFYWFVMMLALALIPPAALDGALTSALTTFVIVMTVVGFPATLETLTRGRSVGKAAVGLRVVRDDGGPIRFRHALVRAVTAAAIEFPGLLMPGISWLAVMGVMLVHPSGKRFGDLAAGTIVIHERTAENRMWAAVMPVGLDRWAEVADMTRLDDRLALSIRHFLARNHDIAEPARTRLGLALAGEAAKVVTPPPPPGTPGWAYLAALLAERHRRSADRLAANRAITAQVWDTLYEAGKGGSGPARVSQGWVRPGA
ncbi:RDD family protein [Stackebrandtia soli]|uniref:RDD family protein n=1 Tax=Stackebrandtia soli TaxID=1892856 RepID=UPI0039ECE858